MPAQKRKASDALEKTGRRRSGRLSSSAKKSQYFEADTDNDADLEEDDELVLGAPSDATPIPSHPTKRGRGRPPKSATTSSTPRRGRPSSSKKKAARKAVEPEAEEEEDDDGDDYMEENDEEQEGADDKDGGDGEYDDELGSDKEPRVTITPLAKMRDTGGVPYADEKVHKNTMLFLRDLKANNKRAWLKANDAEYRRSLADWNTFVENLMAGIIAADPTVPELPTRDVVFRIYRDVRFSRDPTPYKAHYAAAFSRTGRKGPYACYYVHCDPGACFVGGGLWMPDAARLARLRRSVDRRPRAWRRVLGAEAFRAAFLPGARTGDDEACVRAFARHNKEGALKTKPKGFNTDHRDIELLKLRSFTVGKKIPDSIFTAEDAQDQIVDVVRAMVGFVTFLNDIVMPDLNLDGDSSSDEDEEE